MTDTTDDLLVRLDNLIKDGLWEESDENTIPSFRFFQRENHDWHSRNDVLPPLFGPGTEH